MEMQTRRKYLREWLGLVLVKKISGLSRSLATSLKSSETHRKEL